VYGRGGKFFVQEIVVAVNALTADVECEMILF
jgi:hypothetical protein